jgi:4-amino-4-deoxy-L-arabinose transferase-like glycosyltransferase
MEEQQSLADAADTGTSAAAGASATDAGDGAAPAALAPPPPHSLGAIAAPRVAIPLLLALGALLFLVNLGGYPLYTKGEPREAVTVYDMLHGGGIILPMRAGVEIPSKPLLMHWCAALLSLAAGGVTELTVRLPSALFAIAGILVCYLYVRRLFDDPTALIAALMLGTTFQYLQAGTGARVDMTLTFFLEIAFFEFIMIAERLTARRMLLYFAIALAVLAKGPIGLVLPVLVAAVWMVFVRQWEVLARLKLVRGAFVVAILGGGWYAAAAWVGGSDFFRKQIIAENLVRFTGGPSFHEGHVHAFIYVELALLAGFMPWTIVMPITGVQASRRPLQMTSRMTYLLLWFLTVLVFYNLARSKRGVYLLAAYPALATLVAVYITDGIASPDASRRWVSVLAAVAESFLVALGVGGLVGLATLVAAPSAMREFLKLFGVQDVAFVGNLVHAVSEHWLLAALLPMGCEGLGLYLARRPASLQRVMAVTAGGMVCVTLIANLIVVPAIADTLTLKTFTAEVMRDVGSARLGYLGALNYDFAFYSGRNIPIVKVRDKDLPDYLIVWSAILRSMPIEERSRFTILLTSNPTSLEGGDTLVLLRRDGAPSAPKAPRSDELETRLLDRPRRGPTTAWCGAARRSRSPGAATPWPRRRAA